MGANASQLPPSSPRTETPSTQECLTDLIRPYDRISQACLLATYNATLDIPFARMHMATNSDLRHDRRGHLRACYTIHIWRLQRADNLPLMPPCTWCGLPTGGWCDSCELRGLPPQPLCSRCEENTEHEWATQCTFCSRRDGHRPASDHTLIGFTYTRPRRQAAGRRR
jgi:hypothetical protein